MELLKTFCKPSHFNPNKKEKHLLNTLGLELLKQVYQKQQFDISDPYAKLMIFGYQILHLNSILYDQNLLNFKLLPRNATNKLVVFTKEIIIDKFVQERILPAVEDLSSSYIFDFVPKGSKKILISLEAIKNFCERISDLGEAKEQDQASTQEEEKRREEAKISKEDMKRIQDLIKEIKENVEVLIDLVTDLFPKESKEPIQVSTEELDKLRDKRVKEFLSNQESKLFQNQNSSIGELEQDARVLFKEEIMQLNLKGFDQVYAEQIQIQRRRYKDLKADPRLVQFVFGNQKNFTKFRQIHLCLVLFFARLNTLNLEAIDFIREEFKELGNSKYQSVFN